MPRANAEPEHLPDEQTRRLPLTDLRLKAIRQRIDSRFYEEDTVLREVAQALLERQGERARNRS